MLSRSVKLGEVAWALFGVSTAFQAEVAAMLHRAAGIGSLKLASASG